MRSNVPVPERVLDAALEVAALHGLSGLSVGSVAKRAGLSRQTLYKHFASREELISQVVTREAGRMIEEVITAAEAEDDPGASLEVAILTALRLVRGHPLLDRVLATEPESLLPLLVDGTGSVHDAIDHVTRQMLERRLPGVDQAQITAAADLMSRMLISYAVRPPAAAPELVARSLSTAIAAAIVSPDLLAAASPA